MNRDPKTGDYSLSLRALEVGGRSPLYSTSAGKAILSTYSNEAIRAKWEKFQVWPYTPRTITMLKALMQDISLIRQRSYALDMEENEPGLFSLVI